MADFRISGRIIRKKNVSSDFLTLIILPTDEDKSTQIFVHRKLNLDETENAIDPGILYRFAIVQVKGHILLQNDVDDSSEDKTKRHVAYEITLIQCAPDPNMISSIFPKIVSKKKIYSPSVLRATEEELLQIDTLKGRSRRLALNKIISRLEGKDEEEERQNRRLPKRRLPHMKRKHLLNLERIEKSGLLLTSSNGSDSLYDLEKEKKWKLCQPCSSDIPIDTLQQQEEKCKQFTINVPLNAENTISTHGFLTRGEYIEGKKMKQVAWFISRIKATNKSPRHILDVGGGRGDLAVQLAVEFKKSLVTVVDQNESSLNAGEEYSGKLGVSERMTFWHGDFRDFIRQYQKDDESNPIDYVVALHACGDLSDLALEFANKIDSDFLVCPCCYTKQYLKPYVPPWYKLCETPGDLNTLKKLAELNERPDISRRACNIINSMRVVSLDRHEVHVEEYDPISSKRNIALVGEVK